MGFIAAIVGTAVVIGAVWGVVRMTSSERYREMTEKEFEEEAKRVSGVRGAMLEIQKLVDPGKKVEYVAQADNRVEGDRRPAGGSKEAGGD
jgi:hypothetical protein